MSLRAGLALVSALTVVASGAAAHASVKFDGANVFTDGTVAVSATGATEKDKSGQNSDATQKASQTIDAPLSVSAKQGSGSTLATAFTHQDAYAEFYNKRSGSVDFSGNTSLSVASPTGASEAYNSGTSFDYDFTLTSPYAFTVDYSYAETDGYYIANYFQLINTAGGPPLFAFSPPDGTYSTPQTGSASYTLGPGSYEFGAVTKLGDFQFTAGSSTAAGSHEEHYDFNLAAISAAPEPGAWMLMLAGVGAVGAMLGFRKRWRGERQVTFAAA